MNFVATQIRRLWDAAFVVAFVLGGLQIPVFFELYRHRLDEKRATLEEQNIQTALPALREQLDLLAQGGVAWLRVLPDLDWNVAGRTIAMMQPGLRFDLESLLFGAAGGVVGLMLAGVSAALLRLFLPRQQGYAR